MEVRLEPSRYELDVADAREAHRLESEARAILLALPHGAEALEGASRRRLCNGRLATRARAALALRDAVKEYAPSDAEVRPIKRALGLLAASDAAYWRMVLRHDRFIRKDTNQVVAAARNEPGADRRPPLDWDDTYHWLQLGWLRGAMRWDPDRGIKFPTMAQRWGREYEIVHRERGVVHIPQEKPSGRRRYFHAVSLETPIPGVHSEGQLTIGDTIADEATMPAVLDEADERARMLLSMVGLVSVLNPTQRHVIERVYLNGEHLTRDGRYATFADVGRELGISRERVRQIESEALAILREVADRA